MSPTLHCKYSRLHAADWPNHCFHWANDHQNRKFPFPQTNKQTLTFSPAFFPLDKSLSLPLSEELCNSVTLLGIWSVVFCLALCCLAHFRWFKSTLRDCRVNLWGLKVDSYCSKCCLRKTKKADEKNKLEVTGYTHHNIAVVR